MDSKQLAELIGQYGVQVATTGELAPTKELADALDSLQPAQEPFQQRVQPWMMACFGADISADRQERNHRFFEESTELVQACGMTQSEAHQLVDYVYGRPVGEKNQEVGGVMVTLAALCLAQDLDMHAAGETELARIWTKVEKIRAKQAAKPKHSPLPEHASPLPQSALSTNAQKVRDEGALKYQIVDVLRNHGFGGRLLDCNYAEAADDIIAAIRALQSQSLPSAEGDAEDLLPEARRRIAGALPEDEPDCVPDWVCKLLINLGMGK